MYSNYHEQPKGCVNDRFLRLVTVYTHTLVLHGFMSDVMCARCNDIHFLAKISDGSPFTCELSGLPCGQIFFNLVSIINYTPPFSSLTLIHSPLCLLFLLPICPTYTGVTYTSVPHKPARLTITISWGDIP